jgi:NADH:ubiquinone oxidoreductase subunit 6 (subunit J)
MSITKNDTLFYMALLCAIWFALAASVWVYWAALFIAYPFGIIAFLLWRYIKNENRKRNKAIPIILLIGLMISIVVLIGLLITN